MQSKLKLASWVTVFVAGAFLLQASAQSPVYVQSVNNGNNGYLNYMMGSVSLPGNNNFVPPVNYQIPNPSNQPTQPVQIFQNTCPAFLNAYQKFGDVGDEVAKLQIFLNEYNGANLNGKGYFGPATEKEVKNLQYAYGINPTGAQYEKTTMLINGLKCGSTAKKDRIIYISNSAKPYSSYYKNISNMKNLYPNPGNTYEATNLVKDYPTKNTPGETMVGKVDTKESVASSSTFMEKVSKDWQKIKENYKAYILVFLLVLALFWFLRKAATE